MIWKNLISWFNRLSKIMKNQDKNQIIDVTNYHIRQKEKYKELKVQIGINGDLKDEIPQDY